MFLHMDVLWDCYLYDEKMIAKELKIGIQLNSLGVERNSKTLVEIDEALTCGIVSIDAYVCGYV